MRAYHAVLYLQKTSRIVTSAIEIRPHFGDRKRPLLWSMSDRYLECRCAACALRLSCDHRGWREHPRHERTWRTSHWARVPTCEAGLLRQEADSPDETSWPSLRAGDLLGPPDPSICEKHCCIAVSPTDETTADQHDPKMATPVPSVSIFPGPKNGPVLGTDSGPEMGTVSGPLIQNVLTEAKKRTHFGAGICTQNEAVLRTRNFKNRAPAVIKSETPRGKMYAQIKQRAIRARCSQESG